MDLWEEYREVRADGLRNADGGNSANAFYLRNREQMDMGASVSWTDRIQKGNVSAIQGAMNRWIDDPEEFYAEDQNEPRDPTTGNGKKEFVIETVSKRTSGLDRFTIPEECTRLTAVIDVQQEILYYCICAWNESFGGSVIDYGEYPKQQTRNYTARDPRPSLSDTYPDLTEPQRIFAGLSALTNAILGTDYPRQGSSSLRVLACLIDSGYQSPSVYQMVRQSDHASILRPSKGIARSNTARGIGEWKARPGERKGYHWRETAGEIGRTRMIQFDPDIWKTYIHTAMTTPPGGVTGITLFNPGSGSHEMFASHLWAETSEATPIRGAIIDKWSIRVHKPDNHFFDCLTGCAVGAATTGLQFTATPSGIPEKKPKTDNDDDGELSFSEMQALKRRERR